MTNDDSSDAEGSGLTSLEDELFDEAVRMVLSSRQARISVLHKQLGIGFARCAEMLEKMETYGLVGEMSPNGSRQALAPVGTDYTQMAPYGKEFCRTMVQESWRLFLTHAAVGSREQSIAEIARLDERIETIANVLPLERRLPFLATAEQTREELANEYAADPNALKRRLGVQIFPPSKLATTQVAPQRQSLGELAVKTAVRATIWESIVALFRLFK